MWRDGRAGTPRRLLPVLEPEEIVEEALLYRVFCALSDLARRCILGRLGRPALLVSGLVAPFDTSVLAVSRHIRALVRAGLVRQERTGRIKSVQPGCGAVLRGGALAQPQ